MSLGVKREGRNMLAQRLVNSFSELHRCDRNVAQLASSAVKPELPSGFPSLLCSFEEKYVFPPVSSFEV